MSRRVIKLIDPELLPQAGIILAVLFWLVDAVMDVYVFEEENTLLESIFTPEPVELWMRCLVIIVLILFACYAKKLLTVRKYIAEELSRYKDDLEQLVVERTNELERTNAALQEEIRERKKIEMDLERLATIDPLTLLFNRRKFDELFEHEMEKERRYRLGLSLIFCDIDNFKKINDKYGHDIGDYTLSMFASKVKNSLRKSDVVARWGGEEFVILIPYIKADVAKTIAEKIRREIESTVFKKVGRVTASFGVTHFQDGDNRESILKRADKALYKAKESGRNLVEMIVE